MPAIAARLRALILCATPRAGRAPLPRDPIPASTPPGPSSPLRTELAILVVAAAYFISGRLGLLLAIPPGYATAIWPASGIALACVLILGRRVWPGVWIGSFLINVWTALDPSRPAALLQSMLLPGLIACGASAQALVGASLIRRFVRHRNILEQELDVVRLLAVPMDREVGGGPTRAERTGPGARARTGGTIGGGPIVAREASVPANVHAVGSLPRPLSSFIGREDVLADAERLLGDHRLLTLTGPGGSGKTRVAIELANRVERHLGVVGTGLDREITTGMSLDELIAIEQWQIDQRLGAMPRQAVAILLVLGE